MLRVVVSTWPPGRLLQAVDRSDPAQKARPFAMRGEVHEAYVLNPASIDDAGITCGGVSARPRMISKLTQRIFVADCRLVRQPDDFGPRARA